MFSRVLFRLSLLTVIILFPCGINAQQADSIQSGRPVVDTILAAIPDTVKPKHDSTKKSIIDAPIYYQAVDSASITIDDKTVFLFGKGNIKYQDFELTSDYIESDIDKQQIRAVGKIDTSNKYVGKPVFKQGKDEYNTDSLYYNLKSGKGLIYNVITEQGEGYLHSELTKRDKEGRVYVKNGKYTTCDSEHPHFYMKLTKAIVIPDDKIIAGPAYLIVEDIPIKMAGIPFGFFPNTKQRAAGLLLPRYGEEQRRGFYLRDFGWYQPLGDYLDLQMLGTWYSKGSWGGQMGSNYKWRYHFGGRMNIFYNVNDYDDDTLAATKDFKWTWSHTQDSKSTPGQNFSANVNFSNSGFDKNNSYNARDRVTNQKSSSISFTKNWAGTPFNLSLSANADQNTDNSTVNLSIPSGSFSMSTIYPFRKKEGGGKYKWYENIGINYGSQFAGKISTKDSLLFKRTTWENMNKGYSHNITPTINLKTDKIKILTISPSISYQGRLYDWYIRKHVEYNSGTANENTPDFFSAGTATTNIKSDAYSLITDTIHKITYVHAVNPSIGFSLTPKIYGMYVNTRTDPRLIAIRHVMTPRASFSYTPNMNGINPDHFDTVSYISGGKKITETYSYYSRNMYGAPSSNGQSGSLSLSLGNNLEAKMKPKNDTTGKAEPQKVALIRNLNLTTSYNPFAKEFKWSDVSMNGSTQLFKNKLNLQVNSRFSPYDYRQVDTNNKGLPVYEEVDEFFYKTGKGLMRFTNLSMAASMSLRSEQGKDKDGEQTDEELQQSNIYRDPMNPDYEFVPGYTDGTYVDFSIPWSLNINYNWSLNRNGLVKDQTITHTVGLSGDFSLTPKWKIGFNTNYNIITKEVTSTNFNIFRDLHCWEMSFTMVPFGQYRNYSFTIRAKSNILRDLKYDKKQSWYDNY